ncbi:hypothetical protein LH29_10695 [Draconibacterium sediminis]|uniref:Uncharacterized protein n=1 Tax=Draconibacterium sediminis TaxID=1544798 RepID=A0A0D8J9K0_9BACT|nr:hypothetical protein LH29_10695 [Draconibacterium sediminis]
MLISAGTFPMESSLLIAGIFGQKSKHTEGKHNVQKRLLPGTHEICPAIGDERSKAINFPASLQY